VIVSFLSLLAWFALLRRYLASRIGAFSFMTPLFGVALGAWLLNETISSGFLVGAFFVVVGVICVNCYEWLEPRLSPVKLGKSQNY
jgi:drug/metabolite transporter (DMT)-like permease